MASSRSRVSPFSCRSPGRSTTSSTSRTRDARHHVSGRPRRLPRVVTALARFPALTRLELPLIFAPAAAHVAALRTACPGLLFAAYDDLPPTAVAVLALRAFPALPTLVLVVAAPPPGALSPPPPPACAASRASPRCARTAQPVQEAGTDERVGPTASSRPSARTGSLAGSSRRCRMPLAETDEGTEDARNDEDEDAPL
ncbi:hypothetical protein FB451DRAFT_1566654 [Mycena latifolia]|nr:hypothetical protein FB451DRAFT_1566654 [Mycena latifolia]